jgi:peptide-methionine (S)-S-oxide reductase
MIRSVRTPHPTTRRAAIVLAGVGAAGLLALFSGGSGGARAAEAGVVIPPPAVDEPAAPARRTESAVFAGGCFWGVQGVFQHVKGVTNAVSGYSGGKADTAHYEIVGSGLTGHAESVEVTFDPAQVSYGKLLQVFFSVAHNPTQLNYQGPDHGSQYRSALFPMDDAQRKVAEAYMAQLGASKVFNAPIATRIEPYRGFFPAEGYHQNFLTLNPDYGYIVVNDLPKIRELERLFPALYSPKPVLVPGAVATR